MEIKVQQSDLEADIKIHEYLHYTDYFALAVLPEMLEAASDKIDRIEYANPEVKGKIGLISCDMGAPEVSMFRPMKRIDVPLEHAIEVRDAVVFGAIFDSQRIGIYLKDPSTGRPTEFNSSEYPIGDSAAESVNKNPQVEGQMSDQGEMMGGPNQQDYTQDKPMKSDSELARERERRERAAAQREELQAKMRAELSEKFEVLPKILAERMNTLPLSDQQVWSLINDTPGINANQIVDYFQSVSDERYRKSKATVARAVDALKQAGLVEFRGARKNGGYHVPEDVLSCSSDSCAMCGRATLCDSFLPADTIS
ncbi:MarR family transcriptional regulator [Parabacteroides distasonis]|nr:MarR family transcriptional regulator [Parabacteroides distasonis]